MEHNNPNCFSSFFKNFIFLSLFLSAFGFAHGQCPIPFPKGDIDSTFRNVPVATVVTRNDITYFGSGIPVSGDSLSISQTPVHGTVTIVNDSTIIYTPYPGFVGTDFYVYTLCNPCGNCSQASVSINVKPYCPAPVAVADHYTVYNNVPNTLNVTSNDQNVASGPLTVSLLHQGRHGTATVSGTNITYNAQSGFVGLDTLVYLIADTCPAGHNTDSARVYLNVITCQPVSANNDTFTVQQQSTATGNLAANDLNASGFGTTTVTLLNAPKFGGTATISGTSITYVGGPNGFGLDTLKYRICTDCGCDTALAIFRVTQKPCSKPIAVPDNVYAGYALNCTNIFSILANDTIPINGGNLTVSLIGTALYGTATLVNGTLHYTCTDTTKAGQTDFIRYSICNACFCDTTFVGINITHNPCNGLNPVVNRDSAEVCRNYPVTINVTANDYSPQGFPVTVNAITGQGALGTAAIVGNNIVYTPNANVAGTDFFVYQACDNGTPRLCNIATVQVRIDSCNTPPVILNTAGNSSDTVHVSVYEDSSTVYCLNYINADSPQVYIAHIGISIDTIVANTLSPTTHPCISITPPTNSRAQQTVQVVICNETPKCDTVLVIISVIPVNHAPVAHNDAIAYSWASPCSGANVLRNDTDIDLGDHLHVGSFDTTTANGGKVTLVGDSVLCYTADSNFTGVDTFRYTVCDTSNACSTAYVVVSVPLLARNDEAETKQDSTISIHVTANDTRASNEYVTLCSVPQHGTASVDSANNVAYTPAHDYPVDPLSKDTVTVMGMDSFCYTLCHVVGTDTSCSTAEVYVVILPKAKFYIPQGISPNGDGVNDKFVIAAADEFPNSQLLVYNRYGDEVWRNDADGYLNNFDGTWKKNGQPLPDGSYWYIFRFNDGKTSDRMGYIVIQR